MRVIMGERRERNDMRKRVELKDRNAKRVRKMDRGSFRCGVDVFVFVFVLVGWKDDMCKTK